ncbi:hypothetical protein BGZ61DRAFT_113965 [Ilyonectria robusta]|uniref:uncharacterized protein n=1 Tax=Ilyonectria robusta TaxID=1079257 RepID=UPI001E8E95CA|nr:uncharacterized protein BGZ61DRAFT_113965 [Ilyonectria robusta]KAH8670027.1 hypothetical protein BGZ61DRAFT_113965 [Ilyonectria robusta]
MVRDQGEKRSEHANPIPIPMPMPCHVMTARRRSAEHGARSTVQRQTNTTTTRYDRGHDTRRGPARRILLGQPHLRTYRQWPRAPRGRVVCLVDLVRCSMLTDLGEQGDCQDVRLPPAPPPRSPPRHDPNDTDFMAHLRVPRPIIGLALELWSPGALPHSWERRRANLLLARLALLALRLCALPRFPPLAGSPLSSPAPCALPPCCPLTTRCRLSPVLSPRPCVRACVCVCVSVCVCAHVCAICAQSAPQPQSQPQPQPQPHSQLFRENSQPPFLRTCSLLRSCGLSLLTCLSVP